MLKKSQKRNSEGFTIIEIMIVLAIAALILLIVFLAVPALQRGSRNTQRKNDVGDLASGMNNFVNNNNGALPTTVTIAGGQATVSGAGLVSSKDIKVGYYPNQTITVQPFASAEKYAFASGSTFFGLIGTANAAAPPAATVNPDSLAITSGATCQGGTLAVGNTGLVAASSRDMAITYELEQSGSSATAGGVPQCQDI